MKCQIAQTSANRKGFKYNTSNNVDSVHSCALPVSIFCNIHLHSGNILEMTSANWSMKGLSLRCVFFYHRNILLVEGDIYLTRYAHSHAWKILAALLRATKWRDNDLLTANVEKISNAGENAEHMPRVALVPAALGPSDFCEVQPSVIALLHGRRTIVWNTSGKLVDIRINALETARTVRGFALTSSQFASAGRVPAASRSLRSLTIPRHFS